MNEKQIQQLLQSAMPPLGDNPAHPDLWSHMRRRMDRGQVRPIRFGVWDWALAAALTAAVLMFPGSISGLLCHL